MAKYRITLVAADGAGRVEEFEQDTPLAAGGILRLPTDNVIWRVSEIRDGNDGWFYGRAEPDV